MERPSPSESAMGVVSEVSEMSSVVVSEASGASAGALDRPTGTLDPDRGLARRNGWPALGTPVLGTRVATTYRMCRILARIRQKRFVG